MEHTSPIYVPYNIQSLFSLLHYIACCYMGSQYKATLVLVLPGGGGVELSASSLLQFSC